MDEYRPPYLAAAVAGLGVLLLYVVTLSPSTAMWDASEYIATAYILGIPHPPGNPLFVVLGRAWILLLEPLGLPVAVRVNLLAASTSALAAGFYFLVAHRVLWGYLGLAGAGPKRGEKSVGFPEGPGGPDGARKEGENLPAGGVLLAGSGLAVLLSATAFTVWNQSTVNEKVYTVSVAIQAAVVWLVLRWRDRKREPGSLRFLLAAVYLVALGSTNHLMSVLPLPAAALFVLLAGPEVLLKKTLWVRGAALAVVGLSMNFFLPIRAAQRPVINEGDPTCASAWESVVAVYTGGRAGCEALAQVLTRAQYQKPPVHDRQAPFGHQLLNYFQYFDWQWARGMDPSPLPGGPRTPVTLFFLIVGVWGLRVAWRGDREAFWLLSSLTAILTVGLVYYLNFKYGYSLAPHISDRELHEVRERDYFFIAGFGLWGVLAGLGLAALWQSIARVLSHARRHWIAAPVLAVALIPLVSNWEWASRRGDYATRDWAYNLLMSVEPYGILFTNGDNDTFPLWYLQEVEGIRQDVTVIVGQYLYTSWFPKQLQELTSPGRQRPFLPEQGGGIYQVPVVAPSGAILSAPPEILDRVVGAVTGSDLVIPLGEVELRYPAGTYLDRGDQMTLAIIRDSFRERPIYFATPSSVLGSLGLERWAVRHGLVAKLVPRDLEGPGDSGLVKLPDGLGGEWFDVPRTLALMEGVYSYRGFTDREVWTDRASLNIPWYFYATALQLAGAVSRWEGGDEETVRRWQEKAASFLVTAQGGRRAAELVAKGREGGG